MENLKRSKLAFVPKGTDEIYVIPSAPALRDAGERAAAEALDSVGQSAAVIEACGQYETAEGPLELVF